MIWKIEQRKLFIYFPDQSFLEIAIVDHILQILQIIVDNVFFLRIVLLNNFFAK